FQHDQVGIAMPGGTVRQVTTPIEEAEADAAEGAVAGAVGGSVAGAVAGALVSGLVPGIGPVIGGGMLTGILLGAAAGAAGGSYRVPDTFFWAKPIRGLAFGFHALWLAVVGRIGHVQPDELGVVGGNGLRFGDAQPDARPDDRVRMFI